MMTRWMLAALVTLCAIPASAQQVIPGINFKRLVDGTAARPADGWIQDPDTGRYRIGADNEGFTAGGTLRWDYNTARLKLSSGYTLDWNTTSIDATDIGKIDGITNGTGAAGKALVLDTNLDITGIRHLTISGNFTGTYAGAATPTDCSAPQYSFTGDTNTGVGYTAADSFSLCTGGTARLTVANTAVTSTVPFVFSGSSVLDGTTTANTIDIRNGTNIQTLRLYRTYTDASNYERLTVQADANNHNFSVEQAGTGASKGIFMSVPTGRDFTFRSGGSSFAFNDSTLALVPTAGAGYSLASRFAINTAPTISSGFGTSPSIVASNGTAAFTIDVGTGGTASTGVIGLPAATTGWAVQCMNTSTNTATVFLTKQTATTTTTATIGNYDAAGAAAAWVASNVLVCSATAY